jgi:hypothetical protein
MGVTFAFGEDTLACSKKLYIEFLLVPLYLR